MKDETEKKEGGWFWPVAILALFIAHGLYNYLSGMHAGELRGLRVTYQAAFEIADEGRNMTEEERAELRRFGLAVMKTEAALRKSFLGLF